MVLAFWLNLLLLPCAMAMEAPDDGHDCCPPSIELQPLDCCVVDDFSVDHRKGSDKDSDKNGAVFVSAEHRAHSLAARAGHRPSAPPPGPEGASPPLYVLNCVYLK